MGALNGNIVEDLRDRLAERDRLIGEIYNELKYIKNTAINGLSNHRDIISGACDKLIDRINYWQE